MAKDGRQRSRPAIAVRADNSPGRGRLGALSLRRGDLAHFLLIAARYSCRQMSKDRRQRSRPEAALERTMALVGPPGRRCLHTTLGGRVAPSRLHFLAFCSCSTFVAPRPTEGQPTTAAGQSSKERSLGQLGWYMCHCSGRHRMSVSNTVARSCVSRATSSRSVPWRVTSIGGCTTPVCQVPGPE